VFLWAGVSECSNYPVSDDGVFLFLSVYFASSLFFCTFVPSSLFSIMKYLQIAFGLIGAVVALTACGEKKKSTDIITQRVVKTTPKEPVTMQEYTDERHVDWLGKSYLAVVHRQPCDSLPMVKDETGQKFVDNVFMLAIHRQDGSTFYQRTFTKAMLAQYLDDDYRKTGVFEGLVFDRVDGDNLIFAASVGHPQTDEYIPLVITLSRMGNLTICRDTQMDTNAQIEEDDESV